MIGEPDPLYVVARRVLLDALDALGPHREACVLVGAQAVYLRPVRFGLPLRVARARCWFYAARAARAGGDRDRALEYLSTALATDPTLTDGLVDQAELFLEEGMAVAGREALRTALKQDSRHGRANYRMGLIVRAQGDPAQARYYFEQALHNASDPDFQARVQRDLDGLR